ncbi:MAG: hypothetical protein DRQ64_00330 [Gammaproteobacteria bacterium]|nr:MAG: hypothetical protein DRQ64_00330 [Gammaproteobacteria bacterium]
MFEGKAQIEAMWVKMMGTMDLKYEIYQLGMRTMKNAKFTHEEILHGWSVGWEDEEEDILMIECVCGHLSVRDRDQVQDHVCPGCGFVPTKCGVTKNEKVDTVAKSLRDLADRIEKREVEPLNLVFERDHEPVMDDSGELVEHKPGRMRLIVEWES